MRFRGKEIDVLALWGNYVDLPADTNLDHEFSDLVFCPNPEHPNSRTPAFQVNLKRPTVHCFSHCGVSGSYEHAVCLIEGIYDKHKVSDQDIENNKKPFSIGEPKEITASRTKVRKAFREARKIIYKTSSVRGATRPLDVSTLSESRNRTGKEKSPAKAAGKNEVKYERFLPKDALRYLEDRGIDQPSRGRWKLGYDEESKRLVIPVFDDHNNIKFLIRRGIHPWQRPAYLYPVESEKSSLLFGACNLDKGMVSSHGLILVEGSLDCIKMHQWGYRNTVAILGNSISKQQINQIVRLRPKRVYSFFDKDAGGVTALQSLEALAKKYPIKVVLYPKGENLDPAALTYKQVKKAVERAIPLMQFKMKLQRVRREAFV